MSLSQDAINESEIAKNYVMNSDLDEDYKTNLVDLINTSLIATNGISPEEKIQRMTDSIQKLAVSQIGLIKSIKGILEVQLEKMSIRMDEKIVNAISEANKKQCSGCKAMNHANDVEKEKERKKIIADFVRTSGLKISGTDSEIQEMIQSGQLKVQTTDGQSDNGSPKHAKDEKLTIERIVSMLFKLLEKPYIYIFGAVVVLSPYGIEIIKLLLQYFGNGGK